MAVRHPYYAPEPDDQAERRLLRSTVDALAAFAMLAGPKLDIDFLELANDPVDMQLVTAVHRARALAASREPIEPPESEEEARYALMWVIRQHPSLIEEFVGRVTQHPEFVRDSARAHLLVAAHGGDEELSEEDRKVLAETFDPDQRWFWTPEWQAGEREADAEIRAGKGRVFEDEESFLAHLDEAAG